MSMNKIPDVTPPSETDTGILNEFTEEELALININDPVDLTIIRCIKAYNSELRTNNQVTDDLIEKHQCALFDTFNLILRSDKADYSRRWNIILHFVNESLSNGNSAWFADAPFRGFSRLPSRVSYQRLQLLITFLARIGLAQTRAIAIRNTNLKAISNTMPTNQRERFEAYFAMLAGI